MIFSRNNIYGKLNISTILTADPPVSAPPIEEAAALLSAMAGPRRLAILCRLAEGEASAPELARITGLSAPGVAAHLAQLRRLGLIAARRQGIAVTFSLKSPQAKAVLETLHALYCAPHPTISAAATDL